MVSKLLTVLIDAIYLEVITNAVMDFGKSKFEVAETVTKDEYLRE